MSFGSALKFIVDLIPTNRIVQGLLVVASFVFGGFRVQRFRNGAFALHVHHMIYVVSCYLCFALNTIITYAVFLQPGRSDFWGKESDGSARKPTAEMNEAREKLLAGADVAFKSETLVALYDSLPKARAEQHMIGKMFRGKIVRTNGSVLDLAEWILVRPLQLLGLRWGKRYITAHIGDPLMISWHERFFAPLPAWGNVAMIDTVYRGELVATMRYEMQPWDDMFSILKETNDELVLLGCWTCKGHTGGWFMLKELKELK